MYFLSNIQHTIHTRSYYVRLICIKIIIHSGNRKVRTTEVEFRVLLTVQHYFISHHIKLKPFESTLGNLFLLETDSAYELHICETCATSHVVTV